MNQDQEIAKNLQSAPPPPPPPPTPGIPAGHAAEKRAQVLTPFEFLDHPASQVKPDILDLRIKRVDPKVQPPTPPQAVGDSDWGDREGLYTEPTEVEEAELLQELMLLEEEN